MQNVEILETRNEAVALSLPASVLPTALETLVSPAASPAVDGTSPPLGLVNAGHNELPPILVADDDADDVFFIERLIKKTGVKNPVKTFNDGSEVVNFLGALLSCPNGSRRIPHLLFLDLKMAGLGGFGFLEWARQQKGLLPLTIVVLSNSNHPEDVAHALSLGAHRYLVKYPCVQTVTTIVRSVYPFTLARV